MTNPFSGIFDKFIGRTDTVKDWDESEHPRDAAGKFSSVPGTKITLGDVHPDNSYGASPTLRQARGKTIAQIAPKLEDAGYKKTGGYESSSGRSATYKHPNGHEVSLSEPKKKKYHNGALVEVKAPGDDNLRAFMDADNQKQRAAAYNEHVKPKLMESAKKLGFKVGPFNDRDGMRSTTLTPSDPNSKVEGVRLYWRGGKGNVPQVEAYVRLKVSPEEQQRRQGAAGLAGSFFGPIIAGMPDGQGRGTDNARSLHESVKTAIDAAMRDLDEKNKRDAKKEVDDDLALEKGDPDQPRDEQGRWTSSGGGSLGAKEARDAAYGQMKMKVSHSRAAQFHLSEKYKVQDETKDWNHPRAAAHVSAAMAHSGAESAHEEHAAALRHYANTKESGKRDASGYEFRTSKKVRMGKAVARLDAAAKRVQETYNDLATHYKASPDLKRPKSIGGDGSPIKKDLADLTIDDVLEKESDEVKECVKRKIPIIAEDHPEWEQDQRVAVAFSMCRKDVNASLNGLAERRGVKPEDVDQEQLRIGQKHEMEHTSDPRIAQQIALDHLTEDPDYYKKPRKNADLMSAVFPSWAKNPKLAAPDRRPGGGCCG